MRAAFLPLFFLSSLVYPAIGMGADAPPSQVTLPIGEYERLKLLEERPAITVVDTLRVGGSFKDHNLTLLLTGRAAGKMPAQPVLSSPAGIRVYGCEGDAILTRGNSGFFDLLPLQSRFNLRCRLASTGSDRLQLETTPTVL